MTLLFVSKGAANKLTYFEIITFIQQIEWSPLFQGAALSDWALVVLNTNAHSVSSNYSLGWSYTLAEFIPNERTNRNHCDREIIFEPMATKF